MNDFCLVSPSLELKENILDFLNEFKVYNSDLNGSGDLYKVFMGYSFEDALDSTLKLEDEVYASSLERVPSKTYLFIRKNDNKIIGIINIRLRLTDDKFSTNIGYSIRPTERGKGYNNINLSLGLIEAKKLGLKRVLLDCEATNIASYKTIEHCGGKLILEEIDPEDGILTRLYSIDL